MDMADAVGSTVPAMVVGAIRWVVSRIRYRWRLPSDASRQLEAVSSRYARRPVMGMPVLGRLLRPEVAQAFSLLQKHHALLLTGEGGAGKTAVALCVAEGLRAEGDAVLYLRCDALSPSAESVLELSRHLGLRESLVDVIGAAKRRRRVTVVLDQLDSVAGTPLLTTVCTLVRQLRQDPGVLTLAVSRTHQAEQIGQLSDLQLPTLAVEPLADCDVLRYLRLLGLPQPPARLASLGSNLLNLSLIAELVAAGRDLSGVEAEVDLWDRYFRELQAREGEEAYEAAIRLAVAHLRQGERVFSLSRPLDYGTRRLISRAMLQPDWGERYRFRHEDIQDYLYAWEATARRALMPAAVLIDLPAELAPGVLRWMHRIYHRKAPLQEARFVREMLGSSQAPFYTRVVTLDVLQQQTDPDSYVVQVLLECLADTRYSRYFFHSLGNPSWLRPLIDAALFSSASEQAGHLALLWWAAAYMERVAGERPREVVAAVSQVSTRNEDVLLRLVRAINRLQPLAASTAVPSVVRWLLDCRASLWVRDSRTLMTSLARSGYRSEALQLLVGLTQVAPRPEEDPRERRLWDLRGPSSRHDEYWVQQMLAEDVPLLAVADPWPVLELLEDRLCEALSQDEHGEGWADPRTASVHWRAQIDPGVPEPIVQGYRDALLNALCRLVERLAEEEQAAEVLSRYRWHRYAIFRRLALFILGRYSAGYPQLIANAFLDPDVTLEADALHESLALWQAACSTVSDDVRLGIIDRVVGLALEEHREALAHAWLWAARDTDLPVYASALLDRLVAERGEAKNEPLVWFSGFVAYSSPLSEEAIAAMAVPEVACLLTKPFSEIEKLAVPAEGYHPHSPLELARALETDVARRPEEYAEALTLFLAEEMAPEYLYYMLSGFARAWAGGADLVWPPILRFCAELLTRMESDLERQAAAGLRPDIGFDGVHGGVANLLGEAYRSDVRSLPDDHDEAAKALLFALLRHPDPSTERDEEYGEDAATGSLNVVRGMALHALVRYALHRARTAAIAPSATDLSQPMDRLEDDVQEASDDRLRTDPSPSVRAVFGMLYPQLCYLDRDWAFAARDRIFDKDDPRLWRAAWRSYVSFNAPFPNLYHLLRPNYQLAVEDLASEGEQRAGLERADERLATHLAAAYWFGWEELGTQGSLIELFLERASPGLRGHAIAFLASGLRDAEVSRDSAEWARLKRLWSSRLRAAKDEKPVTAADEVVSFSGWLASVPEGLDETYDLVQGLVPFLSMAHVANITDVIEYLETQASTFPALATRLLMDVLKASRYSPELWSKQIRAVLEAALTGRGEEGASRLAVEAINLLGEMGQYEYRDLLPPTPDP